MKATTQNGKLFHYMAAAEITFVVLDEKTKQPMGQPTFTRVNCLVTHTVDQIGIQQLAVIQNTAQMALKQKIGDEEFLKLAVLDVLISNVFLLGFMTPDEFHHRPEPKKGLELVRQQMAADTLQ
ncbi:hypothetical protein [Caballeronia sp. LZ034LL]|uniref:hypothetical protein n=1 Tax=Caballeronia sp. LZ034LL TaxID=3038567 RepID=UPI0028571275|nr:hypothetical protein [Caballeronia sp. LZ034LL]MDR5839304.1 hypothetical protein [Caballeronia sp. LZ034LL]